MICPEAVDVAREVSRAVPEWSIVMMPPIHYGHSGANRIGEMPVHPKDLRHPSVDIAIAARGPRSAARAERLRMDFVLNGHGAPAHNIATNEACDFVSERFGVKMLHVTGLFRADPQTQARGAQMNAGFFSAARRA